MSKRIMEVLRDNNLCKIKDLEVLRDNNLNVIMGMEGLRKFLRGIRAFGPALGLQRLVIQQTVIVQESMINPILREV